MNNPTESLTQVQANTVVDEENNYTFMQLVTLVHSMLSTSDSLQDPFEIIQLVMTNNLVKNIFNVRIETETACDADPTKANASYQQASVDYIKYTSDQDLDSFAESQYLITSRIRRDACPQNEPGDNASVQDRHYLLGNHVIFELEERTLLQETGETSQRQINNQRITIPDSFFSKNGTEKIKYSIIGCLLVESGHHTFARRSGTGGWIIFNDSNAYSATQETIERQGRYLLYHRDD